MFTIAVVDTVDEAVELANASTYSLSSALWTNDMRKALEVARRIYSGKVIVNGNTIGHESRYHQQGWGYVPCSTIARQVLVTDRNPQRLVWLWDLRCAQLRQRPARAVKQS